jgi:hypothetical protein
MKSTVVYFSQSGNTKKVADAIASALPGEVALANLSEAPPLEGSDVVFVGMPLLRFTAPPEVCSYLREACAGRRVALFVTHAAPEEMPELGPWLQSCRASASGTELAGFFNCQGQLAEPVRRFMADSGDPMLVGFAALAEGALGQPDELRLERARAFARSVAGI